MMTKKHFISIADILKKFKHQDSIGVITMTGMEELIGEFIQLFKKENYNFDEGKFRDYINSK